jgi:hypothetical protein
LHKLGSTKRKAKLRIIHWSNGEIATCIYENVNDIQEVCNASEALNKVSEEFPIEIFDERNDEEDMRMIIKYSLAPWLGKYFGAGYVKGKRKKQLNPTRRDNI